MKQKRYKTCNFLNSREFLKKSKEQKVEHTQNKIEVLKEMIKILEKIVYASTITWLTKISLAQRP